MKRLAWRGHGAGAGVSYGDPSEISANSKTCPGRPKPEREVKAGDANHSRTNPWSPLSTKPDGNFRALALGRPCG